MITVRALDLSKAYAVYKRPVDSLKELIFRRSYHETFWALQDVSLELAAGGSIGVVGDNGAGKSTLLRLLAGTVAPTSGTVTRSGRVAAILELGAGFHTELTGRENMRLGCAVMGLSPAETTALLPSIIEFSELGEFVDRPVKTYSSGMFLRLGFSVATVVAPNVLIVDEHLAVGDQHFRKKCMDRIVALLATGTTLVFCSHDLYSVREVCRQAIWLDRGRTASMGATADVLDAYQDHVRARDAQTAAAPPPAAPDATDRPFGGDTCIRSVELGGDCRGGVIETGGRLSLTVTAQVSDAAWRDGVHLGTLIVRNDLVWAYGVSSKMDGLDGHLLTPVGAGQYVGRLVFDGLPLLAGQYTCTVALLDHATPHVYDLHAGVAPFKVQQRTDEVGMAQLPHRWERVPAHALQDRGE